MPQDKKPKKRKWPGVLGRPIHVLSASIAKLVTEDTSREGVAKAIEDDKLRQRIEKLSSLMTHYGISGTTPRSYFDLSLALACEFVDGFKIETDAAKPVGRGAKWSGIDGVVLLAEVTALMEGNGWSQAEAIRFVVAASPDRYGKISFKLLRNTVLNAKKRKFEGP